MILIVFALPEESQDFRRRLQAATARGQGANLLVRGTLEGRDVVVAHTGMGATAAAARLPGLLREWKPALVIGAGFAGGLRAELQIGDVVADLRGQAITLPAGVRTGALAAAGTVLETAAAKAAFAQETGALAVDMESAAGAAACAAAETPFVVIRAISDRVDDPLPVPTAHWFDLARQRPRPGALLWFLARHPGRILPFARFVVGLRQPRAALAKTLAETLRHLR
jgi:adenosylhomocysteine nucleosidase